MNIINLTPHEINVQLASIKITFPASGNVARVQSTNKHVFDYVEQVTGIDPKNTADTPTTNTIPVSKAEFGETAVARDVFTCDCGEHAQGATHCPTCDQAVTKTTLVSPLPAPEKDTYLLVSMMVAQANPHRNDLLVPDTSPSGAIRDDKGRIIAVRGFQTFARDEPRSLPPAGYLCFKLTSTYYGSHPEYGEGDEEYWFAAKPNFIEEATSIHLQHGHLGRDETGWTVLHDLGVLQWNENVRKWLPV
jgi:hypothetical protein